MEMGGWDGVAEWLGCTENVDEHRSHLKAERSDFCIGEVATQ